MCLHARECLTGNGAFVPIYSKKRKQSKEWHTELDFDAPVECGIILLKILLCVLFFKWTLSITFWDAVAAWTVIKFDLIILDIMMPGKSGLEFTIENKDKLYTPIILLTAKGEAEERIYGLEVCLYHSYIAQPLFHCPCDLMQLNLWF